VALQLAWFTMIRHPSRNLYYLDKVKKKLKKKKTKKERIGNRREETKKRTLIKTERKKEVKVKYA
jgi:hypothetical protein